MKTFEDLTELHDAIDVLCGRYGFTFSEYAQKRLETRHVPNEKDIQYYLEVIQKENLGYGQYTIDWEFFDLGDFIDEFRDAHYGRDNDEWWASVDQALDYFAGNLLRGVAYADDDQDETLLRDGE